MSIATFLVFALDGLVLDSWAVCIPGRYRDSGHHAGQMSMLLLCVAAGSPIALPTAGYVSGRSGMADSAGAAALLVTLAGVGNVSIAIAAADGLDVTESNGAFMHAVFNLGDGGHAAIRWQSDRRLRPGAGASGKYDGGSGRFMRLRLRRRHLICHGGRCCVGCRCRARVPEGMSAAADDPKHAATRVSLVSITGYVAFLAGPPLLGFLGDIAGIRIAFMAVEVTILIALVLAGAAKPSRNSSPQFGES